jgi:hypothetical protein
VVQTLFVIEHRTMYTMSITLDLPPHVVEAARKYAASEGISLDALVARTLEVFAKEQQGKKPRAGRLRGTILAIADDFDAPLDDFKDYMP